MAVMIWEKEGSSFEIQTQGVLADGRPALDEIVAHGAFVHLEQMSHDHWWMGLEAGGKYFHLNISSVEGRLLVQLSDQGENNEGGDTDGEWEGDNRPRPFSGDELES